jgi:histone deacetylase complex regulatory component SIN3
LLRANDPIYELALIFGGHRKENAFWAHTLTAVARYLGVADPVVVKTIVCVDKKRQWRHWTNVWHNAAIRSVFQSMARIVTAPVRRLRARPRG